MSLITMGGMHGGGARTLGPLIANKLDADYIDRLFLATVAKEIGATVAALHQREERPPTRSERYFRVLQRILERSAMSGSGGDPYFGPSVAAFLTEEYEDIPQPAITRGHEIEDDKYIEGIKKVLHGLAIKGNTVVVGRGSHVILGDEPNVLRIGMVAKYQDRLERINKRDGLSMEETRSILAARDSARAYYFKRFFDLTEPDNPDLYHLVINTSEISSEAAVALVVDVFEEFKKGTLGAKSSRRHDQSPS